MSNGETLQEYNTNLAENNDVLDNILDMVNNLPEGGSGGSSLDIYSTEEIKTNKVWIDGKPIYMKTIIVEEIGNNKNFEVAYNIENVDMIWVNGEASFVSAAHETLPTSCHYGGDDWIRIWVNKNLNVIRLRSPANLTGYSAYVTLNYTKTTDTGTEVN